MATESVAAKTGDTIGGLLNATLGNLTELVIALAALGAGEYMLVKASIAGAIVTNSLFMLGGSFLLGGLKHHVQEFNRSTARLAGRAAVPRDRRAADSVRDQPGGRDTRSGVHGEAQRRPCDPLDGHLRARARVLAEDPPRLLRQRRARREDDEEHWPIGVALATLAGVTVLVALVSEVFVASVQDAALALGMSQAFVGFIVVALVGAAAEMAARHSPARARTGSI